MIFRCVQSCIKTRCFERAFAFPFDLGATGNLNAPYFGSRYFQLNAFILVGDNGNYSYVRSFFLDCFSLQDVCVARESCNMTHVLFMRSAPGIMLSTKTTVANVKVAYLVDADSKRLNPPC